MDVLLLLLRLCICVAPLPQWLLWLAHLLQLLLRQAVPLPNRRPTAQTYLGWFTSPACKKTKHAHVLASITEEHEEEDEEEAQTDGAPMAMVGLVE